MFDELLDEAASRFNLPAAAVSTVVTRVLALMANERTGGPEGIVDLFRRVGAGDVITSWYAGNEGRLMTASHVESALGAAAVEKLASASRLPRATAGALTAFLLPRMIGSVTPDGVLPSSAALLTQVLPYDDSTPQVPAVDRRIEPTLARADLPR